MAGAYRNVCCGMTDASHSRCMVGQYIGSFTQVNFFAACTLGRYVGSVVSESLKEKQFKDKASYALGFAAGTTTAILGVACSFFVTNSLRRRFL